MRRHPAIRIFLMAILGFTAAALAPARTTLAAAKTAVKTHQATGEVLSISGDSLLLLHARGRAKQRIEFVLTAETRREGEIAKGERIIVYYQIANGRRMVKRMRPASVRHVTRRLARSQTKH